MESIMDVRGVMLQPLLTESAPLIVDFENSSKRYANNHVQAVYQTHPPNLVVLTEKLEMRGDGGS